MENRFLKLTYTDHLILESYKTLMEGLAEYLPAGYEFVLHSLENLDRTVIQIINGHYTGRMEGAPITDLALSMLAKIQESKEPKAICYFNKNNMEKILKATTIPIIGEEKKIIGLLCINFYTDVPLIDFIEQFMPQVPDAPQASETFTSNTDEIIVTALEEIKDNIMNDNSISLVNKNKEIINELYERGIFNLKNAVIEVADNLSISKNTVYMHLRKINTDQDRPPGQDTLLG